MGIFKTTIKKNCTYISKAANNKSIVIVKDILDGGTVKLEVIKENGQLLKEPIQYGMHINNFRETYKKY